MTNYLKEYEPRWTQLGLETNEYIKILIIQIHDYINKNKEIYKFTRICTIKYLYEKHLTYIGNLNDYLIDLEQIILCGWNLKNYYKKQLPKLKILLEKLVNHETEKHRQIKIKFLQEKYQQ